MLGSEAGVNVKLHMFVQPELLYTRAPIQDALHAADVHPVGVVKQPAGRAGLNPLLSLCALNACSVAQWRQQTWHPHGKNRESSQSFAEGGLDAMRVP